ncbi:MAG: acetyl-CoA carboxylase biotin carboxyl carrier protein subunit [Bryobacteraceae bacterium]
MKYKVEAGGKTFDLGVQDAGASLEYTLSGAEEISGQASLVAISPGVYSVLLGTRSISLNISKQDGRYEATSGGRRLFLSIADKRDRSERQRSDAESGPVEVRAQMPGKIISLLVEPGAEVTAGQGLLVIEAMKMQNELKAPKSGTVSKMLVSEGETVPANHRLVVIE